MMQINRVLRSGLALSTAVLGMVGASIAQASFKTISVTPTDARATVNTSYRIKFTAQTGLALKELQYQFKVGPTNSNVPTGLTFSSPAITAFTIGGVDVSGDYGIDASTSGLIKITKSSGVTNTTTNDVVDITISNIQNNQIDQASPNDCDSITGVDTCYLAIRAYNGSAALIDSSSSTYTVVGSSGTTVTATVEPSARFNIEGVTVANLASITTNDAYASGTDTGASAITTTYNTVPFGSLVPSVSKIGQQKLTFETNANEGYDVYLRFTGSQAMVGLANSSNNIDSYTGGYAGSATAFTANPTGTAASVNTGWVAARTSDTDVTGYASNDKYSGLVISTSALGDSYMTSTTSDAGTSSVYVSFKIRVNAQQPADTYTGNLIYTGVAKY